jgi:hypothetical protein
MKLHEKYHPIVPLLMQLFMLVDPKSQQVILSLIEELPTFKDFIKAFIARRRDRLISHIRGQ